LTLGSVWVIGEYADVLLHGETVDDGEETKQVTETDLVDLFELVLNSPYANTLIRQYVLVATSKLSARLAENPNASTSTQQDRLAVILATFSSSLDLEIQQRAVEFGSLFEKSDIKAGVLERMPPPEIRATMMGTGQLDTDKL